MPKSFTFIVSLIILVCLSKCALRRRSKKNSPVSESPYSTNGEICKGIYQIGIDYNLNKDLPKKKESDFSPEKLVLFAKIKTDVNSGIFNFMMLTEGTAEYFEMQSIVKFFQSKQFPPKYNWFDMKGCCLKIDTFNGQKVYEDICYSMIFGFIQYRYWNMITYVDRSFQESMRSQEYAMGEVPLTESQIQNKLKMRDQSLVKDSISQIHQAAKNPLVLLKGGRRVILDKNTFDFPSDDYFEIEKEYMYALKRRLERGCAISSLIPVPCQQFVRVCPFFYDSNFKKFNSNAEKEENNQPNSKTLNFVNDKDTYFSYQCLKEGYFLSCVDRVMYYKLIFDPETNRIQNENIGDVDEMIRRNSIKVYYFGSVTATSDLDFTIVTFESNTAQNFQMQRNIIDNFNNRFQNDMKVSMVNSNPPLENACYTTGDCFDTNAYLTGFMENKLSEGKLTGIPEIDDLFRTQTTQTWGSLNDVSFTSSSALGMMALVNFWAQMEEDNLTDMLDLEYGVNFQEGIISEFKDFAFSPYFFRPLILSYYKLLKQSENAALDAQETTESVVEFFSSVLATEIIKFSKNVHDDIRTVKKFSSNLEKEIGITSEMPKFRKSIKLNEGYTLLSMDSIEEITHVSPVVESLIDVYHSFILRSGTSLMYANEAYYNSGGIKYQTGGSQTVFPCATQLEAAYMIMGYDLLHYYELYPFSPKNLPGNPPVGDYSFFNHGDALLKLAKYFQRIMGTVQNKCTLYQKPNPIQAFEHDFQELGFIDDDPKPLNLDDVGAGYQGPSTITASDTQGFPDVIDQIQNMRVLNIFSKLAMELKKSNGNSPLILYSKVIILEQNVLKYFKGYIISQKIKSIGALAKLASYMLTSMTFNFYLMQKIWSQTARNAKAKLKTAVHVNSLLVKGRNEKVRRKRRSFIDQALVKTFEQGLSTNQRRFLKVLEKKEEEKNMESFTFGSKMFVEIQKMRNKKNNSN